MSEGLAAVQTRIGQLQTLLGITRPTAGGNAFTTTLDDVVAGQSASLGGGSSGGSAQGRQAVSLAQGYVGVPYRWGGTDPATGLDCSGLVQTVYAKLGVTLPRVAADQAQAGQPVASLDQAQPGDLVFFGSPAHHVGIYVGGGKMIDAPHTGSSVGVHSLWGTPSAIRRVTAPDLSISSGDSGDGYPALNGLSQYSSSALLSAAGLTALQGTASASGGGDQLAGPYAQLFTAAGQRHGVDPALLSAVAKTESGYRADAVSPAGARGLMQLMPDTAHSLGVNPDDPTQAVDGAARLLAQLLGQFDGQTDLALAGYNAGAGAVHRYGGVPPYPETQTYVRRVNTSWEALR